MKRCLLLVVIWIGGLYFSTAADQGKKYYVQFIQGSNDEKPPTAWYAAGASTRIPIHMRAS